MRLAQAAGNGSLTGTSLCAWTSRSLHRQCLTCAREAFSLKFFRIQDQAGCQLSASIACCWTRPYSAAMSGRDGSHHLFNQTHFQYHLGHFETGSVWRDISWESMRIYAESFFGIDGILISYDTVAFLPDLVLQWDRDHVPAS
eukprot:5066544-Amphidinium_carterae.1